MAAQLRRLQMDDAGAGAGHSRAARDLGVDRRPAARPRLHYQRCRHFRHYLDSWCEHVPLPHAVGHHAIGKPDRLGRDIEPDDAFRDAAGDTYFPADRARLYGFRVPRAQRGGYLPADRTQFRKSVLRDENHVVFCLDSRPWLCLRLRHSQRRLA